MGLDIIPEVEVEGLPEEELKRLTRTVLDKEGHRGKEVALLLTDDTRIHSLNRAYRKIDSPTDVLSFPMVGDEEILGDIAISVETAKRQAVLAGHAIETELKLLLLHGLLHLCGYDHDSDVPGADTRWKKTESKYLGHVFGPKESSASRGR